MRSRIISWASCLNSKKLNDALTTFYSQLQEQMKLKQDELQTKLKTFQAMPASTPDAIKADKQQELARLQQALAKFKEDAQTSFQKKQSELLSPILQENRGRH